MSRTPGSVEGRVGVGNAVSIFVVILVDFDKY